MLCISAGGTCSPSKWSFNGTVCTGAGNSMGRCHCRWELRLNQSVKPHHLPQQMIQKPLWRGKVSFLCTSSKTRGHTHAHPCTHRHHKWEVSVSLRGLTLISRQRNTLPPFYFYQDHLRIDQVLALLWHGHKNKINSDVLFIYFPPQYLLHYGMFP